MKRLAAVRQAISNIKGGGAGLTGLYILPLPPQRGKARMGGMHEDRKPIEIRNNMEIA